MLSLSPPIFLALALLLSLLTTPTTASSSPVNTHPVTPRTGTTPTCSQTYGAVLNPHDCVLALRALPAFYVNPSTGPPPTTVDFFSRTSPSPRFRLPQRASVGSCAVFVDVVDPSAHIYLPWWGVGDAVGAVILDCAERGGGMGGRVVQGGFFAAVVAARGDEGRDAVMRSGVDLCITRTEGEVTGEVERCLAEARGGRSVS